MTAVLERLQQYFDLTPAHSKVLVVGVGITGVSVAKFLQNLGLVLLW